MLGQTFGAGLAVTIGVQTSARLGTDTDAVTDLDVANSLGANANGDTDDFVADTAGVVGGTLFMDQVSRSGNHWINEDLAGLPIHCAECAYQNRRYRSE